MDCRSPVLAFVFVLSCSSFAAGWVLFHSCVFGWVCVEICLLRCGFTVASTVCWRSDGATFALRLLLVRWMPFYPVAGFTVTWFQFCRYLPAVLFCSFKLLLLTFTFPGCGCSGSRSPFCCVPDSCCTVADSTVLPFLLVTADLPITLRSFVGFPGLRLYLRCGLPLPFFVLGSVGRTFCGTALFDTRYLVPFPAI